MSLAPAPRNTVLSAHVRYPSRESVIDALVRLDVARGAPLPVWPPRRLPFGIFVSPEREGWISLWSPVEDVRDWFPQLTATLECPGVLLEAVESRFWIAELLRDGDLLGRMELPTEGVLWDDLWARAVDSLEAEGVADPAEDEARLGARMDEIAASEEYREDMRRFEEERPAPEVLAQFLPPHASVEQAWELLTAIDQPDEEAAEEPYAEDYMEAFASYLGIRDAAWSPGADLEAFSEGDYEDEEGVPDRWREFVVLPIPHLPVL